MAELEPRLQPNTHLQTLKPESDSLQIPSIPPAVYLCQLTLITLIYQLLAQVYAESSLIYRVILLMHHQS